MDSESMMCGQLVEARELITFKNKQIADYERNKNRKHSGAFCFLVFMVGFVVGSLYATILIMVFG